MTENDVQALKCPFWPDALRLFPTRNTTALSGHGRALLGSGLPLSIFKINFKFKNHFTVTERIPESEFVPPAPLSRSTSNPGPAVRRGTRRFINGETCRRSRISLN